MFHPALICLAAIAGWAAVVAGHTSSYALTASGKVCTELNIPISVVFENFVLDLPPFNDNFDVTEWVTELSARNSPSGTYNPIVGTKSFNKTYTIGATFCTPFNKNGKERTVLLATHGIGFERSYWAAGIQPELYSFADFVVSQGYSTFFYDRVGTGLSTKVDGYGEAQIPLHVAVLKQLTQCIYSGTCTPCLETESLNVIHVGHSLGSVISSAFVTANPTSSNGLVLTGFSFNGTALALTAEAFQPKIATTQSAKWGNLSSGYLTWADIYANVNAFFREPAYDRAVAAYAEDTKTPFAVGELITALVLPLAPLNYTAPALIITGEFDYIFCGSYCPDVLQLPATEIFAKSKAFEAYNQPGTGHGMNFHYNATGTYQHITDFLSKNGL